MVVVSRPDLEVAEIGSPLDNRTIAVQLADSDVAREQAARFHAVPYLHTDRDARLLRDLPLV